MFNFKAKTCQNKCYHEPIDKNVTKLSNENLMKKIKKIFYL
jgi:hypothetical protein